MAAGKGGVRDKQEWDAVIVGASLAGCSTAIMLGQAGARVALVDKQPEVSSFKRVCGHYIQPCALTALDRLGLLQPIYDIGGRPSRLEMYTPWGWFVEPAGRAAPPDGINLRREVLDPLVRARAAATPGVELMLGRTAERLTFGGGKANGVELRTRDGAASRLKGKLVIGADGRASRIAELIDAKDRRFPHGRFSYGAYFEDETDLGPHGQVWMLDPDTVARFPTDSGLTLYACMPTHEALPRFKRDLIGAIRETVAAVPDAPPIETAKQVSTVFGKVSMPDIARGPVAAGVALVGDAALTGDPAGAVGCGWAFEGGVRLADTVAPALLEGKSLDRALTRYSLRHRRDLAGFAWASHDYATGRRFTPFERMLFSAATRDAKVSGDVMAIAGKTMTFEKIVPTLVPRAAAVNVRHALRRRAAAPPPAPVAG